MHITPRHYAWMAVALFATEIAVEAVHVATRQPWLGFSGAGSLALSAVWSTIWFVAAVGLLLHRKWGGGFGVAGALASLMHGLIVMTAGAPSGMVYMVAGITLVFLLKRASPWFGWRLFDDEAEAKS